MNQKFCTKCQECKSASLFSKDSKKKDGLCIYCKSCQSKYASEYGKKNKEIISAKSKIYYEKNKSMLAESGKIWRENNKERKAKTDSARRERIKKDRIAEKELVLGRKIVTRKEAIELGVKHYFTGNACKYGHIVERFTSTTDCTSCHKEKQKAWRSLNPDKVKASFVRWVENNKERDAEVRLARRIRNSKDNNKKSSERYFANKERRTAQILAWRAKNPESTKATKNNYRSKVKAGGRHTAMDIKRLLDCQGNKCAHEWCKKDLNGKYHVDHIVPISLGGSNMPDNLQILCPTCNLRKSNKHPDFFYNRN